MRKQILGCLLSFVISTLSYAQTNNPVSIYEGALIRSVTFDYLNLPADSTLAEAYVTLCRSTFRITAQSQYSSFLTSYYVSQLNLLPFVQTTKLEISTTSQNAIALAVLVTFSEISRQEPKRQTVLKDAKLFPVLYNSKRTFLTLKAAASQMIYSNNNAWFGQPAALTAGNPLAENPVGKGYTAWIEGFASLGLYGIVEIIPAIKLHLYGGANYLVSFSAGNELFTNNARIYGAVEEAFIGVIGGGHTPGGKIYRYNVTYGRKQFVLGDGWLIINTSMNGYNRAALQLNPRWAGRSLLHGEVLWNKVFVQAFRLQPNELTILNSQTTIVGINVELHNNHNGLLGLSFLSVPRSDFRYYLPDGTSYTRNGLQVFNVRAFKSAGEEGGLFLKLEGGYQRNRNFNMSAWAYYGEVGWNFAKTHGSPAISYRYAYFSGDDPATHSYNRWDALYTGGNGEQWVQGSNMYKIVQNSNEITHRLQAIYAPLPKLQFVGQVWLFYAPQRNNLGGNPALSTLLSRHYGTEYNLTMKFFYSRNWYFHLNTAYTIPSDAIREVVPQTRNWFCLSFFARYSF
ncbi:MAG: alginate export family protein [Alistipes sp.]